jgi:hypothetical protein
MYIANLQKISGVLDDELRPAFQALLTVTKSVELSQYGLNTALEVSAATGASVVEVSNAIAKGFVGQTRALKTLVPGLDEAALKTGDMEAILKQLNKLFAGQATARLTTYAGKMDLLQVATSNATEIIGEGLVDALTELSKDMFFLLPLISAAVGATAGVLVTHTVGEKDRQSAKYHKQIANDLTSKLSNLDNRYNEYVEQSKNQIDNLTKQHALDEAEKDLLRLAVRLQQSLYILMWDIDNKPTRYALTEFKKAIEATNKVLLELDEEPIQIPKKYFSRNLTRVKRREKLAKSKSKKIKS